MRRMIIVCKGFVVGFTILAWIEGPEKVTHLQNWFAREFMTLLDRWITCVLLLKNKCKDLSTIMTMHTEEVSKLITLLIFMAESGGRTQAAQVLDRWISEELDESVSTPEDINNPRNKPSIEELKLAGDIWMDITFGKESTNKNEESVAELVEETVDKLVI